MTTRAATMTTARTSTTHAMAALLLVAALLLQCVRAENESEAPTAGETMSSILSSADGIKTGPALLAVAAVGVGGAMCVAGYRLFRATIFVCGFIVGGIGVASAIEFCFANKEWIVKASWIGFFAGGILLGLIAMCMYKTSIFLAGAAAGVLLAFTVHTTVSYRVSPDHPNTVLVVLVLVLAIAGGILARKLEKPVLVVATSFAGAVMVTWGVGYFAGDFPNGADLDPYTSKGIDGKTLITIPSAWWAYLAVIFVLFVLGTMMQFRKTGRGSNYHQKKQSNNNAAVPPAYDNLQTPPAQVRGTHGRGTQPRYGNPVSHV